MTIRIIPLIFILSFINAQIALPTFHGVHKTHVSCNSTSTFEVRIAAEYDDAEEREKVREITEKENNAVIVASYGTFSTGINIRNLHNVIFASPSKSRIRNLQSIGRVLRKGKNKIKAMLFDIADDCTRNSKKNYTLNHFIERIKIYNSENFNYDIITIQLKKDGD